MQGRSYADVFIYIASVTGLVWALGMAAILQESPASWVVGGAIFGILMALFGAPKLVGETRELHYQDKEQFVAKLNVATSQIGYRLASRTDDFLAFDATDQSSYSIGPIKVAPASWIAMNAQLAGGTATLVGPRYALEEITKRLS